MPLRLAATSAPRCSSACPALPNAPPLGAVWAPDVASPLFPLLRTWLSATFDPRLILSPPNCALPPPPSAPPPPALAGDACTPIHHLFTYCRFPYCPARGVAALRFPACLQSSCRRYCHRELEACALLTIDHLNNGIASKPATAQPFAHALY